MVAIPYIPREQRYEIDLNNAAPETPGQLNYAITVLCLRYLGQAPDYADYNEVVGVLECAKLELYRMQVAPYEAGKILENGNVRL